MKRTILTLAGAMTLLATAAAPALAATSLDVPVVASAPSLDPRDGSGFRNAATAHLSWDAQSANAADQPATVSIERDAHDLYVRFDVTQTAQMIGYNGGDEVAVDLWPATNGEQYRYAVNLDGSRAPSSTPNTAGWHAAVSTNATGYAVTMKIPIEIFAGASSSHVQFSRWIVASGDQQVWTHAGSGAQSDVAEAGTLTFASVVGKI